MLTRGISALVGVALFLGACFAGAGPFAIAASGVAALAAWEWIGAYRSAARVEGTGGEEPAQSLTAWADGVNVALAAGSAVLPLLTYAALTWGSAYQSDPVPPVAGLLLWCAPVAAFAFLTLRAARTGKALDSLRRGYGAVGLLYIGVLMSSLVALRSLPFPTRAPGLRPPFAAVHPATINVTPFGQAEQGAWLMLLVAVCVWATDTGAYLVGKSLGKHKLAPSLSPGKTREGSAGGLGMALLVGALFGLWIHLPVAHGLVVGLIAGVMGQWGDLWESALKREVGLKDFGSIMPGHGGALDRFDSLLFVTPLAFCWLHYVAGF